jgi:error-prone DNA polymerase
MSLTHFMVSRRNPRPHATCPFVLDAFCAALRRCFTKLLLLARLWYVAAAGFSPGEADLLRRALSRSRPAAELEALRVRFLAGAAGQGIEAATGEAIWQLLAGFAGYGFPKSHAASFALIAYQSLYLKLYYPAAFYCALLNQQPMGFYSTEVIIGDARRHGVALLPPDVNRSEWRYTLEQTDEGETALRSGLCAVKGLGEAGWKRIEGVRMANCQWSIVNCQWLMKAAPDGRSLGEAVGEGRTVRAFGDLGDFCRRTGLPKDVVTSLIRAGALDGLGERRALLWELGGLVDEAAGFDLPPAAMEVELPTLAPLEQTAWEYELLGLSPQGHVLAHYRAGLRAAGVLSTWQVKEARAGQRVWVAGCGSGRRRQRASCSCRWRMRVGYWIWWSSRRCMAGCGRRCASSRCWWWREWCNGQIGRSVCWFVGRRRCHMVTG